MFLNDWFWATDHPRVCGENGKYGGEYIVKGGSPPRVRGKLSQCAVPLWVVRITPACAGKTASISGKSSGMTDHPRVCGENKEWKVTYYRAEGSPPRVRGKPTID